MALPIGYKLLEYIESTGTQYIATGLNSTTRYDHEITFSDYTYAVKAGILGSSNYYYSYTGYNNTLRWCMSDRCYDTPGSLTSKRTVKLGYNYLTVDGSSVSEKPDTNGTPSDTIHTLFKGYNCASVKIYSYRASLDGQLLRDFVPCKRNSDGELGMYDLVNNAFYANAGSGEFIAGPVIELPAAPTNLQHLLAVRLAWSAVDDATSYNVYRNGTLLGSTTDTVFVDSTAAENTEYTYGVSAVNSAGESPKTTMTVYTKTGYFLYKPYVESATFQ